MLRHKQAEELKVGIDINSLPLSAQIQVRAKLDEQKREQNQQQKNSRKHRKGKNSRKKRTLLSHPNIAM